MAMLVNRRSIIHGNLRVACLTLAVLLGSSWEMPNSRHRLLWVDSFSTKSVLVSPRRPHVFPLGAKFNSNDANGEGFLPALDDASMSFEFHVAPMQCYTNAPFRTLCSFLSSGPILWTEMEKVEDLLQASQSGLERRFGQHGRRSATTPPTVLQLGSNDPLLLSKCLQHLSHHGYGDESQILGEVNLNCGCPSVESGGSSTFGASLMKQPALTRELIQSIGSKTSRPVSLKCRIAVYDTPDDYSKSQGDGSTLPEAEYQQLCEYIEQAREGGLSHLVLHARGVILSGLSPKKNRQVPKLDYSTVQKIAQEFPSIHVTLNGGIQGLEGLEKVAKESQSVGNGVDQVFSFMAGRWILRRPLDLVCLQPHMTQGRGAEDGVQQGRPLVHIQDTSDGHSSRIAKRAVQDYSNYVIDCLERSGQNREQEASSPTFHDLCLPLYMVLEQLRDDYCDDEESSSDTNAKSERWLSYADLEDMYDIICETLCLIQNERDSNKAIQFSSTSIQFNKVASAFKGLVGTKVLNKWKRNRAEL